MKIKDTLKNIIKDSYKGSIIRAGDVFLVQRLIVVSIFLTVVPLFLLFNLFSVIKFMKDLKLGKLNIEAFSSYYCTISFLLSVIISGIFMYFFYQKKKSYINTVIHRQRLAKMIMENKWYETKTSDDFLVKAGFIKTSGKTEKISYFPKIHYLLKDGFIYIRIDITVGKYQEQLLNLERKLESGLYCELESKEIKTGYKGSFIEYKFNFNIIASRISINEVRAVNGKLKLMANLYWEYDTLPHMLVAGGTGGGKTYFLLTLISALLKTGSRLYILDPKNSDLADLKGILCDVYTKADEMISCLDLFFNEMMKRNEEMKLMPGYKTGQNYASLNLKAHFLIFDEYVAFMEMIGSKENIGVLSKLKQIVMLGRQSGFFLILACQRPDAKYLGDGIRDQFNFRVALGRMSEMGYSMMFGETGKQFFLKKIKGRGYADTGTGVITEFFTPIVPKGYDFLKEIEKTLKGSFKDSTEPDNAELNLKKES